MENSASLQSVGWRACGCCCGTDYPYRTGIDHVLGLRDCEVFSAADLKMIERETPLSLVPRLRR